MSVRRPTTAPWSRLKPATIDPLESMGLPSKGDNRLLNYKSQESYFNKIVDRYMEFCAAAGREDDKLDKAFASLSTTENKQSSAKRNWANATRQELDDAMARIQEPIDGSSNELGTIMMAMRKLREAILASKRTDTFAQGVYIFITRAAILTSTFESYQPALLHLLYRIHAVTPLSAPELREFVGYHILDLTCRLGRYHEAFIVRMNWNLHDSRIEDALFAVVRNDWVRFWKAFDVVDGYQRRLMSWAEDDMRKHALKCLGRTYLMVDKTFLEGSTRSSWERLKQVDNVGWDLEDQKVMIKKIRRR